MNAYSLDLNMSFAMPVYENSGVASALSKSPPRFLVPADTSLTLTGCYNTKPRETPDRSIRLIEPNPQHTETY
jgi:hypothetical protein